jgi:hypothetical protein
VSLSMVAIGFPLVLRRLLFPSWFCFMSSRV